MSAIKLAILGSTRGTDLQAIIDAIKSGELNASIEIVISNKKDAYILERAKQHGLTAVYVPATKDETREEYDQKLITQLVRRSPAPMRGEGGLTNYPVDLVLLIGWMRILSPVFISAYQGKILNVHPSLLPKFAGGMDLNVHKEVLKAGEKETGCTIHLVDETVDGGKILLQKKCKIEPNETVESLKAKVQKLEGEAFVEIIKRWNTDYHDYQD